jgi:hypothetical protein
MGKSNSETSVTLTQRDLQLFFKLNAAGWLTTRQIGERFFPGKSTNAVSKRLRKLVARNYLGIARHNSTECALYRLAGQGKLALIEHFDAEAAEINIPTQVPRKLNHFTAVNDLRFYFEQLQGGLEVNLDYFISEREFSLHRPQTGKASDPILRLFKSYHIIPDALARIRISQNGIALDVDAALEFDGGTEHATFFGRTKVQQYTTLFARSCDWLGDFKVLTFTSSLKRIVSLMKQVVYYQAPSQVFYFAPIEKLNQQAWEQTRIFLDPYDFFFLVRQGSRINVIEREVGDEGISKYALTSLPAAYPCSISPREERKRQENL